MADNSLYDKIAAKVAGGMAGAGSGSRIPSMSAIGQSLGSAALNKFAPKLAGPLSKLMRGDVGGLIDAGLDKLGGMAASKLGKLKLAGGITLKEAERILAEVQSTNYAKKNLWFLQIGDWGPVPGGSDISHMMNLFATDVSYGPWTISSDPKNIGMGVMDAPSGIERTELRITTYDDARGTIRSWFDAKCAKVAHADGTLGLPVEYLVTILVAQSATDEIGAALFGSFNDKLIMRATSIDYELSRSEDGLQQIQMTFTEFDTFMYQGT